MSHRPVLVEEVLRVLALRLGSTVADGTIGSGGHAREILREIGPEGRLIGLDQDPASIARVRGLLGDDPRVLLKQASFERFGDVLEELNVPGVDAVILDIGFSSEQIEDASRGFSFEREGPLDMRMDPGRGLRAAQILERSSQHELENVFKIYGGERFAGRFARAICEARACAPIRTTYELIQILERTLPRGFSARPGRRPSWRRRHPATRVFQALRIVTNDEIGTLERALPNIWRCLKPGGRFAVISFHSMEDRVVKRQFQTWKKTGEGKLVNPKPLTAGEDERRANPRSRSAKLRAIEKIGGPA